MTWTVSDELRPGDLVTKFCRWSRTRDMSPPRSSETVFIVSVVKTLQGRFITTFDRRDITTQFFIKHDETMYYVIVKG